MKKALNAWTVESSTDFETMFKELKEAGFDGVELNVDEKNHSAHSLTLETTDAELAEIKELSKKYGIAVVSISTSMLGGGTLLGSSDASEREKGKKIVRTQLKYAKTLGAAGILIVPGGITQQKSIAKAYEQSMATLNELSEDIKNADVNVAVENVWNGFFMSPYDMMVFIDHMKNPNICAYFDAGNVTAFSWAEYWIEILDKRIKHVHVKDFKRANPNSLNVGGTWEDLLEGDVNWEAVVPALRKTGFDGYLVAEVFSDKPDVNYYKKIADAIGKISEM